MPNVGSTKPSSMRVTVERGTPARRASSARDSPALCRASWTIIAAFMQWSIYATDQVSNPVKRKAELTGCDPTLGICITRSRVAVRTRGATGRPLLTSGGVNSSSATSTSSPVFQRGRPRRAVVVRIVPVPDNHVQTSVPRLNTPRWLNFSCSGSRHSSRCANPSRSHSVRPFPVGEDPRRAGDERAVVEIDAQRDGGGILADLEPSGEDGECAQAVPPGWSDDGRDAGGGPDPGGRDLHIVDAAGEDVGAHAVQTHERAAGCAKSIRQPRIAPERRRQRSISGAKGRRTHAP